jgi:hypothetical protein
LLSKSDGWNSARVCHENGNTKSTFSGWKKKIDVSIDYQSGQLTFHSGPKSIGDHLEHLIDSLIETQETGQKECSIRSIVFEIIKFDHAFKDGNYSDVRKWLYAYLTRYGFSIRKKTHVAQKECVVAVCMDFVMFANDLRQLFSINY